MKPGTILKRGERAHTPGSMPSSAASAPSFDELNCDPMTSFEEYIRIKIKLGLWVRLFVDNRLMRFLARASPGLPALFMMGKLVFELKNYDHVIADLPAAGHAPVFFRAPKSFSNVFREGSVSHDAQAMLETMANPSRCSLSIVSLPEEMPLRETLEFREIWRDLFPGNEPLCIVNRLFPGVADGNTAAVAPIVGALTTDDGALLAQSKRHQEIVNLEVLASVGVRADWLPYLTDFSVAQLAGRWI